jgi:hypothetical protein
MGWLTNFSKGKLVVDYSLKEWPTTLKGGLATPLVILHFYYYFIIL